MRTKKLLLSFLLAPIFLFAQSVWNINGGHSNIGFAIQWQEFAFRTGEFKAFGGSITTENEVDLKNAKVDLKINVGSVDVIADHLGKMLQNAEYLDSAKCPQILFKCESLKKKKKNSYLAKGEIVIKCISKPCEFVVEELGRKDKFRALKVTGKLSKSDFGITGGGDRLGNVILITAYFELNKKE